MPFIPKTAGRIWEPKDGGTRLLVADDKLEFTQAADQARITVITEIQNLSQAARESLAGGVDNLAAFDTALENEEFDIRDRLDYYAYDTRAENLTVADGAWFTPEAVEAFCGERVNNEATNSIDGDNGTVWQHFVDEAHSITYRLRSYPKKITKVRFRYNLAEPPREQLSNLNIRASRALSQIDEVGNLLDSGLNITWPVGQGATWVEHTLTTPKTNARYVKLDGFGSADGSNHAQIREFQVWVETKQVGDAF